MALNKEMPLDFWYNRIVKKYHTKQKSEAPHMTNSTTDTYEIKRKIISFCNKLTKDAGQVQTKFVQDMVYGLVKSKSVLLSNISDALIEPIKKINTIERLSNNLMNDLSPTIKANYNNQVNKALGESPVILVDDSDVIKPHGLHFESLGMVRDGSSIKKDYEKGYMVTEMVAVTQDKKQPISLFSHIHSSTDMQYRSTNTVTYQGLDEVIATLGRKATFVFDRGYDMNELFKYMYMKDQDFVIRLTERRKLFYKGRWHKSTTLRDSRKGKIKTTVLFQGQEKECYISHLNVQITAAKKNMRLLLVYGLGNQPMMLATNKQILSKADAKDILRFYLSRWRIEEYFRFKKQEYDFENFRVRDLKAINNLNQLLTYALGFIGLLADKVNVNRLSNKMIRNSNSIRGKVLFYCYQIAKGISMTLAYAKTGIEEWKNIRRTERNRQLEFNFIC